MGSLSRTLYGGSKSTSNSTGQQESGNRAYDLLSGQLGGTLGQAGAASSQLANLLGLGGGPAQTEGFDRWRDSTGYQFGLNSGMDAITGSAAAKGLLNSGSTAKALNRFGQDYASTKFGEYANQLSGLLGQGLQAGQTIGGAGSWSKGTSMFSSKTEQSNKGISGIVGSLFGK